MHSKSPDNLSELGDPLLHRNVSGASVQNLLARFDAQPAASAASSSDSTDSYIGDDAQCYLHERNEAMGCHWEETRETEHLKAALNASQVALAAMEGESNAARAQLVESDARVAGKILG